MKKIICILCAVCFSILILNDTKTHAESDNTESKPSKFSATFIQNWLCRDWTKERWVQEFSDARTAGFDSLILQSVYDIVRGNCTETGNAQDMHAYPSAESFCMFPSKQPATYHSSQNAGDALTLVLEAAKETGMQLWLGTVNDDLWWKFGWGIPEGTFFSEWSISNAGLCSELITEILERYSADYGEQISGWYYVNEIWNMDAGCDGTDNGIYAEVISENIHATVTAVSECCPEKPVLISPFYNPDITDSASYTAFLTDILQKSEFRSIDIYAGQDGGGKEYAPDAIREWGLAQKKAVNNTMQFWVNHECFNADHSAKPVSQLRENYNAVGDLADGHILFSWNHYYAEDAELNAQFCSFTFETVAGDANADGVLSAADAALLQKWLLGIPGIALKNWKSADLNADDRLDARDLSLLKMELFKLIS